MKLSHGSIGQVILCLSAWWSCEKTSRNDPPWNGLNVDAAFVSPTLKWHRVIGAKESWGSPLEAITNDDDSSNESVFDASLQNLRARLEEQRRASLVEAVLNLDDTDSGDGSFGSLQQVYLVGQISLPTSAQQPLDCAVLSSCSLQDLSACPNTADSPRPCLLVPLATTGNARGQLKLLEFVVHGQPQSQAVLWQSLNPLLVNRDASLFDNIPWSTWSVDPQLRNRDAAGNPIEQKYHLGKRDAYNRFMGKDWQGKSLAIGNLSLRLKSLLQQRERRFESEESAAVEIEDMSSVQSLAKRILEIQIREQEMDIAEMDQRIAVSRQQDDSAKLRELIKCRDIAQDSLNQSRQSLHDLKKRKSNKEDPNTAIAWIPSFLDEIVDRSTNYGTNAAPYRGAIGYAPALDTQEDLEKGETAYSSPYDLMNEIINDQLNAEVIGCVLENTSLLSGTLALGGAVVLRRKTHTKEVSIAGEILSVNDEEEEFGNQGVRGGEVFLVECDSDEAIGMALTCDIPLQVESTLWQRASVMAEPVDPHLLPMTMDRADNVRHALPKWKATDPELSVLIEGQAGNQSATERVSPLRIPRTTSSLFDSIFDQSDSTKRTSRSPLFPSDNPVQSLTQYDEMTNEDKARTLMTISNFNGRLPRPRELRKSNPEEPNVLDSLLLPLIDESIRRQFLIRDAENRGDIALADSLRKEKSRRQMAKEKAELAREAGAEDDAEWWEAEADLYASLRADVTQDEGSYSRFL